MSTYERLKRWLAGALGIPEERITPDATLGDLFRLPTRRSQEDIGQDPDSVVGCLSPDSLDMVELMMGLEEEFDIEVSEEEAEVLMPDPRDSSTTIQQIVDLIDKKRDG